VILVQMVCILLEKAIKSLRIKHGKLAEWSIATVC
jgi:hypothetical protein